MRSLLVFVLTLLSLAATEGKNCCNGNLNMDFKQCGTACPITCSNYAHPPLACTKNCVAGCFCKEGFFKDEDESCVAKRDCIAKPECHANETFSRVVSNCAYCVEPAEEVRCLEGMEEPDCYCTEGYSRNRVTGLCVLLEDCPQ